LASLIIFLGSYRGGRQAWLLCRIPRSILEQSGVLL
jgi:hypothetical protein